MLIYVKENDVENDLRGSYILWWPGEDGLQRQWLGKEEEDDDDAMFQLAMVVKTGQYHAMIP